MALRTTGHANVFAKWQTLLEVMTSDAPEQPLSDTLRRVAASAGEIVGCRYVMITVIDPSGWLEHFVPTGAQLERADILARVSAGGAALDPRELPTGPTATGPRLAVPIDDADERLGGIYLAEPDARTEFSAADAQVAEMVAASAAALIRRVRVTQAYERRHQWLTESAALTRTLLAGEHGDPLRLVVEGVLTMSDADLVAVVRERVDGCSYEVIEAAGAFATAVLGRIIDAAGTFAEQVIADGAARVVTGMSGSGRHAELVRLIGADAAILVPLVGPGVERGMLAVFRRAERPAFTSAEIEATTMFAAQMVLALELAENRAQRERLALLDERDRIARDLHDHVIQRLFAVGLTLQSAGASVDGAIAKRLLASVDDLDETIARIRSTIYRLTAPILSADNSIRSRISRLVDGMEPVLGFPADLEIRGPVDFGVDDEVADDCVAVLREALTNVARHANASRVDVSVSVRSSVLKLQVADDGRGIGGVSRRSGLANLRARAEGRRGTLTLATGRSRGTRLTWRIPLAAAAAVSDLAD
jgi:signal transduction histidine kinase